MFRIFQAEMIKIKRSLLIWIIPIASFIIAFLCISYPTATSNGWDSAFMNNLVFWSLLVGPALFSLFTGFIFSREYNEKTINSLFCYPFKPCKIFLCKIAATFVLMLFSFLISFLLIILMGKFINLPNLSWDMAIKYFKLYIILAVLELCFVPLYALLSTFTKNYILPTGIGIIIALIGGVLSNFEYGKFFPSTINTLILYNMSYNDFNIDIPSCSIISIVLFFTIPFILSLIYYANMDIHSGS